MPWPRSTALTTRTSSPGWRPSRPPSAPCAPTCAAGGGWAGRSTTRWVTGGAGGRCPRRDGVPRAFPGSSQVPSRAAEAAVRRLPGMTTASARPAGGAVTGSQPNARPAPEAPLFVANDEPNIRELLSASLRYAGFEVATAADGQQALALAASFRPDLLVLDVMMPGLDGFGVVRRMRQSGRHTPVLFLTARDAAEDKVSGLTLGGDDYVTKPFSLDEVLARIRAVLRRSAGAQQGASEAPRLSFADIELDEESHEVIKAGEVISLSPTEFKLLRYLMANAGRVLSKAQIL